jgi:hypothetical protein
VSICSSNPVGSIVLVPEPADIRKIAEIEAWLPRAVAGAGGEKGPEAGCAIAPVHYRLGIEPAGDAGRNGEEEGEAAADREEADARRLDPHADEENRGCSRAHPGVR